MAFKLTLSGGGETVDFMDSTNYKVVDEGFDIGTPQVNRRAFNFMANRFISQDEMYEYRDATIKFEIHGTSRSDIMDKFHKIERIIMRANNQYRLNVPVELQYQWDGQTNTTYFDVIAADPVMDPGTLSIEKMFEVRGGAQVLGGLELKLKLSPFGYYISPINGTMSEIPLAVSGASKATGGVTVYNQFSTNADKNWVEIAAVDAPGGGRILTRLEITYTTADWLETHVGHRVSPYPTASLKLEAENAGMGGGVPSASIQVDADASNGNVGRVVSSAGVHSAILGGYFPTFEWTVDPDTLFGRFLAVATFNGKVINNAGATDTGTWLTTGVGEYVVTYRLWKNRWKKLRQAIDRVPTGVHQLPFENLDLGDLGNLESGAWIAMFFGFDSGNSTFNQDLDFLDLIPIDSGYRRYIFRGGGTPVAGTIIDDGFKGQLGYKKTSNSAIMNNVVGLFDPIRLFPGVAQRLYFSTATSATSGVGSNGAISYTVRLYGTPTTLALAV